MPESGLGLSSLHQKEMLVAFHRPEITMANVLITGANRGIGLELVQLYASRGDTMVVCCRDKQTATVLQEVALADNVVIHEVAVSDADSVAALATSLVDTPIEALGKTGTRKNANVRPEMVASSLGNYERLYGHDSIGTLMDTHL